MNNRRNINPGSNSKHALPQEDNSRITIDVTLLQKTIPHWKEQYKKFGEEPGKALTHEQYQNLKNICNTNAHEVTISRKSCSEFFRGTSLKNAFLA